ncbi:MAG: MATE family efflux transporter, partial [Acidobacteriota bacterium]
MPESPDSATNPPTDTAAERSLLAEVWRAIKGDSTADYTSGSIGRAILLLAVPMVLETIMESIFAVVDIFFVSKLGAEAIAAVGLTESLMAILYTVAIGLSIGVTAMVARRIGEKDPDGAARTAVQAIALGFGFAFVVGAVGAIYAPDLLRLMGADEATVAIGTPYTRTMLGGNATVVLLFLINAIFRGAGDAAIAMRVLWTANQINIYLDPAQIFGWGP